MIWKSLKFFWRMNLAVIAAISVTTAVLTGALLIGDSMRGSLRDLTFQRIGRIHYVMTSDHFFRQNLASETGSAAAILLNGSATAEPRRASQVNISAVNRSFLDLFGAAEFDHVLSSQNGSFPPVLINGALQKELQTKKGDEIVLSFAKPSDVHRESILGNRESTDIIQRNRFIVAGIVPDEKMGGFDLKANQHLALNAFVSLDRFQKILNQKGMVNSVLSPADQPPSLKEHVQPEDLGLRIVDSKNGFRLESEEIIIKPNEVEAARRSSDSAGINNVPVVTYLANRTVFDGHVLPYSTITALSPFEPFISSDGKEVREIKQDQILLNEWAANDLQVHPGDPVELEYFVLGPDNDLSTAKSKFKVQAIIRQQRIASDPDLSPKYPGIEDAENMSDWSPPFPVDLNIIRPKDEDYWDKFRATPKGFISESTAQRIWSSRFGLYTSILFIDGSKQQFINEFLKRIDLAQMNMTFRDVKTEGLRAAEGATDFSQLYLGFSMFLIASAILLGGLLFRLNIDKRRNEIGILLSSGYTVRTIQKRFIGEGGLLALVGALLGSILAAGYASLIIHALKIWWTGAVGSTFLTLHLTLTSLMSGFFFAALISVLTIIWSVRILSRLPAVALLKESTTVLVVSAKKSIDLFVAFGGFVLSVVSILYASRAESPPVFFAAGACLLVAGLGLFHWWLRSRKLQLRPSSQFVHSLSMAARNAARNSGRSMLSVALVASACFVIISVGASRQLDDTNPYEKTSGTGGFSIVATTDVPIYEDLNENVGTNVFGFRVLPGDDASCLNLYQPQRPRILGANDQFIKRGGFRFHQSTENVQNPWTLLHKKLSDGVIPAIGDYNSVRWILHKNLGEEILTQDEHGKDLRLRFVALLEGSMLQSEVIIAERDLITHFPSRSGQSFFLIETKPDTLNNAINELESDFQLYGFDAVPATERLASYHAVENTYLSTFQTLGALGLLLGTLGLGVILVRNILERRAELATMRAFGYQRKTLGWLVIAENGFLLLIGILCGSIAAGLASLPYILSRSPQVPWSSLSMTLLSVFVVGMFASLVAVRSALRIPLLPALKSET
jgi:putative ABC transport system permease protein